MQGSEPLVDDQNLRKILLAVMRNGLWAATVIFRENDYRQILEVEYRNLEFCLPFHQASIQVHIPFGQFYQHGTGCPRAVMRDIQTGWD